HGPYGVKLNLYYGGPTMDSARDLWFGADTLTGGGPTVVGGDINQNGTDELIGRGVSDQGVVVFFELGIDSDSIPDFKIKPPNLTHYIDYVGFGEGLIAGDFNRDGKKDVGLNFRPTSGSSKRGEIWLYWNSPTFDTIPDMKIPRPGNYVEGSEYFGVVLEYLGDFNDDGWDDFFASSELAYEDTLGYIYFGGPSIDTIPEIILVNPGFKACLGGDLNNDGHDDLITSLPLAWVTGGFIKIYYGGPDADSIPDFVIGNSEFPGSQEYFGNDVVGIGDFNDDGIDDFAFSAVSTNSRGAIYIIAGWDDATDVPYDYEPTLPNGFSLHQNYPNPFNNSTTISFEIPYKEEVSLKIYNILGKEVKQLINKELSAGTYNLEWDGTDNKGQVVSSGVYFYKLSSSSFTQEMKMVLVK
ncbi:MAG: T9SS type A sorting domain-containing protein, partial [bacterium]